MGIPILSKEMVNSRRFCGRIWEISIYIYQFIIFIHLMANGNF